MLRCRCIRIILYDKCAEGQVPDHILTDLARCFAGDIRAFFTISKNQEAYRQWLQVLEQQEAKAKTIDAALYAAGAQQDVVFEQHD